RESFTRLARGFQDAVEAEDPGAISSLERKRTALFELIASREQALDAERSMALRWAIEHYFESARRVSLRLIRGEAGADVVEEAAEMQARQQRVEHLIAEATFVDRSDLAASFAAARKSSTEASRLVQVVALLGVGL